MKRTKTKVKQVFSVRLGFDGRLMLPPSLGVPWWRAGRRVFFCRKDGSIVISARLMRVRSGRAVSARIRQRQLPIKTALAR